MIKSSDELSENNRTNIKIMKMHRIKKCFFYKMVEISVEKYTDAKV